MAGRRTQVPSRMVELSPEILTPVAQTAAFEILALLHNKRADALLIPIDAEGEAVEVAVNKRDASSAPITIRYRELDPMVQLAVDELVALLVEHKSSVLNIGLNSVSIRGKGHHNYDLSIRRL